MRTAHRVPDHVAIGGHDGTDPVEHAVSVEREPAVASVRGQPQPRRDAPARAVDDVQFPLGAEVPELLAVEIRPVPVGEVRAARAEHRHAVLAEGDDVGRADDAPAADLYLLAAVARVPRVHHEQAAVGLQRAGSGVLRPRTTLRQHLHRGRGGGDLR